MKPVVRFAFITALLMLAPFRLRADDDATIKDRLHKANIESALDAPDVKPWHLLASFQLFDARGQPTETGTIEEWWAGPQLYKIAYSSPGYTNSEIENKQGHFKLQADSYTPEYLEILRSQMVHPMPSVEEIDEAKLDLRKEDFGKVTLDCIMLTQPIVNVPYPPFGLFPTYCLDHGKTS